MEIGLPKFTLSHSPVSRFTRSTNNYAEHLNAAFLKARDLPILESIQELFISMSKTQFERSQKEFNCSTLTVWNDAIQQRRTKSRSHTVRQTGKCNLS